MEEKLRILKMLEEGKITAEQASALLDALRSSEETEEKACQKSSNDIIYCKRMVHIQIHSPGTEDVNLKFPVRSLRSLIQFTGTIPGMDFGMQHDEFDFGEMLNSVAEGLDNQMVGEIVKISIKEESYIRIYVE